jgi:hypothetical protein
MSKLHIKMSFVYEILVGKPEVRPLQKSEEIIKKGFKEIR